VMFKYQVSYYVFTTSFLFSWSDMFWLRYF
jgi:hypothetical protein